MYLFHNWVIGCVIFLTVSWSSSLFEVPSILDSRSGYKKLYIFCLYLFHSIISQRMKLFTVILFLWSIATPCSHAIGLRFLRPHQVVVRLTNRLGSGRALTVHCQSEDDDLGYSTLDNEAEVNWSFRTNILGTTLFYCDVEWGGGVSSRSCYRFDAYDDERDHRRCRVECRWMITSEGTLSGFNEDSGYWEPFALRNP